MHNSCRDTNRKLSNEKIFNVISISLGVFKITATRFMGYESEFFTVTRKKNFVAVEFTDPGFEGKSIA